MSESLRAFGYELPSAIADLVDNSIFAGAKNVWVDFNWGGENSTISVTDDGCGMSEERLINAMRPGSRNPLENRDPKDLGRYGLGLKTASFSQCRRFTVRSKTGIKKSATRCWDLDFIATKNKWLLLREAGEKSEIYFQRLSNFGQGTTVLWEQMDRVVKGQNVDDENHKRFFHGRIEGVEKHLAMVFHRFMEGTGRLKIFVNNNKVEPWDPFLKSEKATQQIGDERIMHFQKDIKVIPYVLPHISKLTPEKHVRAAGLRGWNLHQGFYVYRNERLLVPGDWLGLSMAKEEHFKLARIQLDIPNTMDQEWEIDVTKSKARPPDVLRKELKYIADVTRKRASDIYRHRGRVIARASSQGYVFVWQQKAKHGKYFYRVNRDHPLIKQALKTHEKIVEQLLRMVEETVPAPLVALTNSEDPDKHSTPFEGAPSKEILDLISQVYRAMVISKVPRSTAVERLRVMEPFDSYPELVQAFLEQLNGDEE
ncbi:ATP-binding protein [Candidatus Manganitrophus noduliformans]|nr:ATP-binding protein [Candidatus Manganitrophus noduliformans]